MMANVFKYSRRNSAGKLVKAQTYTGRFKLDGDTRYREVPLHCRDEQVARQKLRQIVLQAEREREGLAVPLVQKECMAASLERLIEEYIAEKEKVGRSPNYTRVLNCRLSIVARECGWKILRSVSGQEFLQWRTSRSESPKTLNEYLAAWQGFLKWVSKRYGLPAIPAFDCVERIDGRGRETYERRALTPEEAQRLLEVAPPSRRLIYVLALSTGLRRAELDSLKWADVFLDVEAPYLRVRARYTKNRRDAMIPLIPQTAAILLATRSEIVCGDSTVIPGGVPRNRRALRRDMEKAGIPVLSNGRKFDFHALRTTCCTFLLAAGVPPRIVQEIMRHSDIRLTTKNYADMSRTPLRESMKELAPLVTLGGVEKCTSICTHERGKSRLLVSHDDQSGEKEKPEKTLDSIGDFADYRVMTYHGASGKMVEAEGLEPTTR